MSTSTASHSLKPYFLVFSALLGLTVLTVALSYVDVGRALGLSGSGRAANIVAGLVVALIKASLVVWIFMHQDHEEGINRFILGFSVALLTLAFLALSADFLWLGTYVKAAAGALVAGR
jgi:caa(3)-type oxidase subunit IV